MYQLGLRPHSSFSGIRKSKFLCSAYCKIFIEISDCNLSYLGAEVLKVVFSMLNRVKTKLIQTVCIKNCILFKSFCHFNETPSGGEVKTSFSDFLTIELISPVELAQEA
jgi:hypothetical protein